MIPRCTSNACRQGRDACPTPEACRLPEADWEELDGIFKDAGFALVLVAVLAAVAVLTSEAYRLFG